jgi:hypothetical protein
VAITIVDSVILHVSFFIRISKTHISIISCINNSKVFMMTKIEIYSYDISDKGLYIVFSMISSDIINQKKN